MVPLFFRNLEAFAAGYIPDEPAAALRACYGSQRAGLPPAQPATLLLSRLFREQQIDFRIFKGIPLAITAFQDATLRDVGDIDLLVAEKDIFKAGEILRAQGYLRFEPQARLTPRRLRSYVAHQKDFSYEHPGGGMVIDLHWRLFRNPLLPANAAIAEVGEDWLKLGAERIPTLPAPRLLLYLCVHGALDGWLRLKWLADIAALLRTMSAEQLASTVERRRNSRHCRNSAPPVILCQDLFGTDPAARRVSRPERQKSRAHSAFQQTAHDARTNIAQYANKYPPRNGF